ncbi:unnamed protein product [Bathycoccus prasinos]
MTPSSTAKGGGAGKKASTNTTTKTTGEQQRKRNQNVSDAMNSAAPPTLAQLLTAAGVPVNPLDGSTTQQQLLQFQQQQNAAANFAAAAALTLSGVTTQLKSFGNNTSGLVGGPASSGGQPASPSFWNQFYAQQALVGSIYGQQQQLQAAQQALSNGANLNNERLSFLSNFSTGMGGGAQPTMSNRTQSSGGNAIFDNEDLKELLKMGTAARTQQLQQQLFGASAGIGEINSNDAAKKKKLSNVNTKKKAGQNTSNNKNNNKRKQPDSAGYQQPGSRGNSAFSPFANSAGDGNNIFTSSELRKVASLQHQKKKKRGADWKKNSKDNSKDNKKDSKDNKATSQKKKPPGRGKGKKQEETNQKTMQLADAAMSFGGEQISDIKNDRKILAEVMKLQEGYLKETPEEREKREKDDAAKKMKQLSTRGHTARATEKEELYKSIVDVDGNLLKPDVLERFEANANKMTQLNKEHEEERKKAGLGGTKNDGPVTDLAQAAAQKITGASDDVMAKVRGILEEELSDAETDIAEGDETGELDSQAAKVKNDDAGTEEKKSGASSDKVPGKDIKVRSRSWSQEEDDLVQVLVSQVGPKKWALIAGQLSGKTQKQAYARWRDYLQPGLTSRPWTRWEETHLLDCQAHIGNQWAILARFMPGRSPNAIKNRFHATKRKMERNVGAFTNEKSDFSKLTPALTSDEELIKKVVAETKAASKKASQTRS